MAKFTQRAIMLSLLKLLEERSIDKITVKDICEMCEINRNTFYYYYSDIYQVIDALMQYETEQALQDTGKSASFYEEYLKKYHLVLEHKSAIKHIYGSRSRDLILNYFYTVAESFVTRFVREEAKGTNLDEDDIQYIVEFYSNSMIGSTLKWISKGMPEERDALIYRISMSYQATIKVLIQSCMDDKNSPTKYR